MAHAKNQGFSASETEYLEVPPPRNDRGSLPKTMAHANNQVFSASETEYLEVPPPRGRGTNRRVQAVKASSAPEPVSQEDSTQRGRGTNRRVQAVQPSSAPEPVSLEDSTPSHTETVSNSDDLWRDELEELGQLITEEVPKTEKRLAKLVTNHKTLDAGQKMGAAASFAVSFAFAVVFLSHLLNSYIKVKNDRAADTIKEQKELCCEIDDSVNKLTDKIKSIVSKLDVVSSGRQSNGAVPAERINKTPAKLILYEFKSGMDGYEYKSDVLEKVEYVRAIIAVFKSVYDLLSKM